MFDTLRTIRWYFRNTIQVWALLCLLMGIGLLFYNYISGTLTVDRGILITVLSAGLWLAGKILLVATRKEVENEIKHLIDYENLLENEITTNDLIQMIPLPALLIEINEKIMVKDANEPMALLAGKKIEEILESEFNDIDILPLPKHDEMIQTLLSKGKIEGKKVSCKNKDYVLWGSLNSRLKPQKALLIFITADSLEAPAVPTIFDPNFYNNLGHDIFDAINVIVGFSSLLEEENLSREKRQQYLHIINLNVRKIQWIISNYLQSYLKENYPLRTATDIENLNLLLEDIQHRLNKEIPGLSQHLHLAISRSHVDEEAFLIIDNQLIYQLFLNLIMFLHEFKKPLKINISYSLSGMYVTFKVSVNAIFPASTDVSEIAFSFNTTKNHISHPRDLNLHIFKKMVQRIEGKAEATIPDDDTVLITFTVPAQTGQTFTEAPLNTLNIFDKTVLSDKHILIVEDIDYNRMLLKEYLSDTGAILHFAGTGHEAIEFCRQYPYTDIILLDIQLPDIDGFKLIAELKKYCPQVIVIAQTAFTSVYDKKRALEAGFNFYLSKPLKQDILLKTLTSAIQKQMN